MEGQFTVCQSITKENTRSRAQTSASLSSRPDAVLLSAMEIEANLAPSEDFPRDRLFHSPTPTLLTKSRIHMFHLDETFQSINRYHSSAKRRPKKEVEADIFFDLTMQKLHGLNIRNFLESHDINERFRAKMMDWMIEVLNLSKQKEETVFRAFHIMDLYFARARERVSVDRLHLIGSVCMFIASKQEETAAISLDSLLKTICRDKFTKEEVLTAELEILSAIEFRVHFPSIFELARCAFNLLDLEDPEVREFCLKGSLLIAKMCLFSYEMVNAFSFEEVTGFSMILSLKLVESFRKGFTSQDKVGLKDCENYRQIRT